MQITIVSDTAAAAEVLWRTAVDHALPDSLLARVQPNAALHGAGTAKRAISGRPTAYTCVGHACFGPTNKPHVLQVMLDEIVMHAPAPAADRQ